MTKSTSKTLSLMLVAILMLTAGTFVYSPAKAQGASANLTTEERLELVKQDQESFKRLASPEEYEKAINVYRDLMDKLSASPARFNTELRASHKIGCVSIPQWAVIAYGWFLTAQGATVSFSAGVMAGSIIGAPPALILGALGIAEGVSGQALVSWAEREKKWPKKVCVMSGGMFFLLTIALLSLAIGIGNYLKKSSQPREEDKH